MWPGRSQTGPMVFFQLNRVAMVLPSRKFPPGKRRNFGLRAMSLSIRSVRRPLGRLLWVGGKSETCWSHRVPPAAAGSAVVTVSLASPVTGAPEPVRRVSSKGRSGKAVPMCGTRAEAYTVVPSADSMATVRGPMRRDALAKKRAV